MPKYYYITRDKKISIGWPLNLRNKILRPEWEESIENNPYWTWEDDTEVGKATNAIITDRPQKLSACAELDKTKRFYKVHLSYNDEEGYIYLSSWPKETKKYVLELYKLAQGLNANLLKGHGKILKLEHIEKMK
jgi:hypothetical protein